MFAGQAALAPRWRVIAWDARGHGKTVHPERPFSYWDLARDLLALMDTLSIERATIGGVSQGGFISLRAALLAPERVSSLLLFDTEASAVSAEDRVGYGQLFTALDEHGPVDELVRPLAGQIIGDHPAADEWVARWRADGVPVGEPSACLLGRDDIISRLPEIGCAVLLARGEFDMSIPADRMALLHQGIANTTPIHVIPEAAHSPPLTHPEPTNKLIASFLADHAESAAA
jgi:pimeloyl-ACP methyl ester carboxylesterase